MNIWKRMISAAAATVLAAACCACAPTAPTLSETMLTNPSIPSTVPITEPVTEPTLPPIQPPPVVEPELPSILGFLKTAIRPVGSTMYVWGGGWNEADTGAGIDAVTLGISPQWAQFAATQDSSYNYKNHRYQIRDGLDCSGYVGWTVYNTLETTDGRPGYVGSSTTMARDLAQRGLGTYIPTEELDRWLPGDIMSMQGHVWIVVGMCGDGSVLLLHASPPGVMFSGTRLPDGSPSQATALAHQIMEAHFPDWHSRWPDSARSHSYLTKSSAMRWTALSDEEGLREMSAEAVVQTLFEQVS